MSVDNGFVADKSNPELQSISVSDSLSRIRNYVIDRFFKNQWQDVWFYPEFIGVKGYMGTQDVMFVGLNPSRGNFPSKADEFFYEELKNQGFSNAHLTDLIKLRATNKEANTLLKNEKFMDEQIEILIREISVVNPILIVAIHRKVERILRKEFREYKIHYVPHYSYCHRYNKRDMFKKQIQRIKSIYSAAASS